LWLSKTNPTHQNLFYCENSRGNSRKIGGGLIFSQNNKYHIFCDAVVVREEIQTTEFSKETPTEKVFEPICTKFTAAAVAWL
jgi:hypothetical protein